MDVISLALVMFIISIFCIFVVTLYFLPAIIAYKKKHVYKEIILLVNFLLGWTLIGWTGTLLWTCIDADGSKSDKVFRNVGGNKYEDLERLQKLKESGAITEEEFEKEKTKILN